MKNVVVQKNRTLRSVLATSTARVAGVGGRRVAASLLVGTMGAALAGAHDAHAINLYDGMAHGNNLEINLNITASWTGIFRTNNPSQVILSSANSDDGDRNLAHGMVSDLFEVTPILDIKDGNYGAHFSGDAYINTVYLGTNQNDSPSTNNSVYIAKNNDYTSATRNVEGLNAQPLDAFVYGTVHFGANDQQALTVKLGRQTLLWGQSLFLTGNGIAGLMAPIDIQTAENNPNAETQQVILPDGKIVATWAPNQTWTFQGYYEFEWIPDFFDGAGSYFGSDVLDKGGQSFILIPGYKSLRLPDNRPPQENGRFGASVQASFGNYDVGLFALRTDAHTPELTATPDFLHYRAIYPRDIWAEAVSLSTTIGGVNVAGETSFRQHMPLDSQFQLTNNTNTSSNPPYATGTTWAGQVSAIYVTAGVPLDPGGVSLSGEVGFNHLLSVTQNRNLLYVPGPATGPSRNATAAQFQFVVTPTYYDVLPNLQVTFPIGLAYDFLGRSYIDSTENHGTGDFNVGVTGTYKVVWTASFTFNDNIGAPNTLLVGEPSTADRNYVMFNIQRAF